MPLLEHPLPGPNLSPEADATRFQARSAELPTALRHELLDPAAWKQQLEKYAAVTRLAVALADADGKLLGECVNPQPTWTLLHRRQPEKASACPFSLPASQPCECVADALRQGTVVVARDRTGLVHGAVPLLLGGQPLGALVTGQVFDQYPEQLPLEQAAQKLDLSPAGLWQGACREVPVSRRTLAVYCDLLAVFGNAFLQTRYHLLREAGRAAELERLVEERTAALREAQQLALQVERLAAIGQMVAGLAHESRNALQRSQACLQMLGWRIQDRPEAQDLLARIQQAQDDLYHIYEGVREYAAPIRLDVRVCDVAEVWWEAWADLEHQRSGQSVELREEVAAMDRRCRADPLRLKQVFRNLLENALAAGASEVVICCSGAEIEGQPALRIAVRDNGPGFTPEQWEKLFQPFYTTKVRGTGLGLALCKRLVESHGGRIEVADSPAPGAEIVLTLPRREL